MAANSSQRPFGFADRVGYMFGDLGNDFTFILSSTFMMKFYTDVMGVAPGTVGLLMMLARFVDAFTDVGMGRWVDTARPTRHGRFRPWLLRICGPVAVSSFLIYQSWLAAAPYGVRLVWMFVTYLLWGSVFYTAINIPYGSMASAITDDPAQRTQLSTWRTIGSTLAGMVIGAGTPLLAYVTVNGRQVLSGPRMTVIAGVFSVAAVASYLACFALVRERVTLPVSERGSPLTLLGELASSRALIGILLAAILLLLSMLMLNGMANYVFPNYYGNVAAQSTAALAGNAAILAVCAPTAGALSKRFGKRSLSAAACLGSSLVLLACWWVRPAGAYGFVVFFTLALMGVGFFNTVIWAMITDVIDDAELRTGRRSDGTIYAVYSFSRKLGQAFSSGLTGALLGLAGYSEATAFDPAVTGRIFTIACVAPAMGFAAVAAVLWLVYPLGRKQVRENAARLAEKHGK